MALAQTLAPAVQSLSNKRESPYRKHKIAPTPYGEGAILFLYLPLLLRHRRKSFRLRKTYLQCAYRASILTFVHDDYLVALAVEKI